MSYAITSLEGIEYLDTKVDIKNSYMLSKHREISYGLK